MCRAALFLYLFPAPKGTRTYGGLGHFHLSLHPLRISVHCVKRIQPTYVGLISSPERLLRVAGKTDSPPVPTDPKTITLRPYTPQRVTSHRVRLSG